MDNRFCFCCQRTKPKDGFKFNARSKRWKCAERSKATKGTPGPAPKARIKYDGPSDYEDQMAARRALG